MPSYSDHGNDGGDSDHLVLSETSSEEDPFDNSRRVGFTLEGKFGQSLALVMGSDRMDYAQLVADEALPADSKAAIVVEVTTSMAFEGKDLAASGFDPDSGVSEAFELAKSELTGSPTDGHALPPTTCVLVECDDID